MNAKSKILLTLGLIGMCLTIISTVSAEDSYVDSAEVLTTDTNSLVEVSNGDSYLKTSEAYLDSSEVLTNDTNSTDFIGGSLCFNDTLHLDFTGEVIFVNHTDVNHTDINTNSPYVGGRVLVNGTSVDSDGKVIY